MNLKPDTEPQLAVLAAPNFFGERSMFEESPATALVKTEDNCLLFALERPQWDQIAARFPALPSVIQNNMTAVRQKRSAQTPPAEG